MCSSFRCYLLSHSRTVTLIIIPFQQQSRELERRSKKRVTCMRKEHFSLHHDSSALCSLSPLFPWITLDSSGACSPSFCFLLICVIPLLTSSSTSFAEFCLCCDHLGCHIIWWSCSAHRFSSLQPFAAFQAVRVSS